MNKSIYSKLKNRILFLEYPPGQILNEKVLAEEFNVSRTPLREILNRLEWEKLVRILPRTGTMVTEIEFRKMINVYQVRLEIEGLVGRIARNNITKGHLKKIENIRDECRQFLDNKNRRGFAEIDLKFRNILHEAANNEVLSELSDSLYNQTIRVWYYIFDRGNWAEEVQAMIDEIEQTHKILLDGNAEAVGNLRRSFLTAHIDRIKSKF